MSVIELVGGIFGLLLVAAATLTIAKRLKVVPFTVLLVAVGIGIVQLGGTWAGLGDYLAQFKVSDLIILYVFLPSLIYESAFNLNARQLRQNLAPVLALAVPGLLISTGLVGVILWQTTDLELSVALLLGAILSATDPVAVIAIFKSLGAPKRLTILVEGESLFNDATAVVLAHILVKIAVASYLVSQGLAGEAHESLGAEVTHGGVLFFREFVGGAIFGWLAALLIGSLLGRVEANADIEISLTLILAYLAFLVGQKVFHVSGVMAVVAAGVTMGGWGRTKISPAVAGFMEHLWEYVAFVANALIFLLVGLQVDLGALWANQAILLWTIAAMLVSRLIAVYGLTPLVSRFTRSDPISFGYQTIMYWGGLRGAIALAIVLSLPELELGPGGEVLVEGFRPEFKEKLIAVVTGAVLFTLLIPGLTIETLVRKLGLSEPPLSDRIARLKGLLAAKRAARGRIPQLQAGGLFSHRIASSLSQRLDGDVEALRSQIDALRREGLDEKEELKILSLRCLGIEKTCYYEMFSNGHITEQAYRDLAHSIELQAEGMKHRGRLPDYTLYPPHPGPLRRLSRAVETEGRRTARVAREYEETWGRHQGCQRVLTDLDAIVEAEASRPVVVEEVRRRYEGWLAASQERLDETAEQFPEFVNDMQERLAGRLLLHAERSTIKGEERAGTLGPGVAGKIVGDLDADLRALRGGTIAKLQVDPTELLRKVPFFAETPADEFGKVTALLKSRTVPAGEDIIRQGDKGDSLFLISRGVVRVSVPQNGAELELATLLAGDFFGEMAFLRGERRSATCRAKTPCQVHELRRADFDQVRSACPAIVSALEDADRQRTAQVGE